MGKLSTASIYRIEMEKVISSNLVDKKNITVLLFFVDLQKKKKKKKKKKMSSRGFEPGTYVPKYNISLLFHIFMTMT